ncbi:type IV pilin protein [Rhodoferax mekongensis]|uniref:type IV pilin protein n=1 Tax=Rhodoferax mekongensis TaxID=3068341 RepID=UPI003D1753DF
MIVVGIVAILSAVAYPSYQEYVRAGRRAEASRAVLAVEQHVRRYFSANDSYANYVLPSGLSQSPDNGAAFYTITVTFPANRFQIRASRVGAMSQDRCGDLIYSESGAVSTVNALPDALVARCFKI